MEGGQSSPEGSILYNATIMEVIGTVLLVTAAIAVLWAILIFAGGKEKK